MAVRRLSQARRQAILPIIPSLQCAGTASTTGQRCKKRAELGTNVCRKHGAAAPQVRRLADERITLAEALVAAPRRPVWEVLEDTAHYSDVLLRQVVLEVRSQGTVSPELLDRLVQALERANRLSKTVLDAGVAERRTRLAEAQATQMFAVFTRVLNALGLTAEQKAQVPELLKREIQGELTAA